MKSTACCTTTFLTSYSWKDVRAIVWLPSRIGLRADLCHLCCGEATCRIDPSAVLCLAVLIWGRWTPRRWVVPLWDGLKAESWGNPLSGVINRELSRSRPSGDTG